MVRAPSKGWIAFIVSLAMFMEGLDATIINTAIPAMATSLDVNPIDLKMTLISYLLSLAVFIPISGYVADKWGIKRVFLSAFAIFVLGSIACGLSTNLTTLILARLSQGFGGALLLPVGRLILLRTFERAELMQAMNRVVMVGAMGVMLGPVLGGLISHYLAWQWIFWVNIPVGIAAAFIGQRYLQAEAPQQMAPFDGLGFLLFGSGLATLTFGLSALSETIIATRLALLIIGVAGVLLLAYSWHSRSIRHPIVKTQLFVHRTFTIAIAANLFARLGFGGLPFLLPLLLQLALGYSAVASGLLLAPMALGMMAMKFTSTRLLRLWGYKRLLIVNTLLIAAILWVFSCIHADSSTGFIGGLTFGFGVLVSLQYSGMNSLAYAEIPPADLSAAASMMATVQQLAMSFGVAVSALLLQMFSDPTEAGNVFTQNTFQPVFLSLSAITAAATLLFLRLQRQDGAQMLENKLT